MPGEIKAGESVGITLTEQIFVERGQVSVHESDPVIQKRQFKARLFWMGRNPLRLKKKYKIKLTTQEVDCEISLNWAKASNRKLLRIYPHITNYRFTARNFRHRQKFSISLITGSGEELRTGKMPTDWPRIQSASKDRMVSIAAARSVPLPVISSVLRDGSGRMVEAFTPKASSSLKTFCAET